MGGDQNQGVIAIQGQDAEAKIAERQRNQKPAMQAVFLLNVIPGLNETLKLQG